MSIAEQNARFARGWEYNRGKPVVRKPVEPPIFAGHPCVARGFSYHLCTFVLRVFHNRETEFYDAANAAMIENCQYYIDNTDVRDDRDSFYWNIAELCRSMLRYGSRGFEEPGLVSTEAERVFLEMALGYVKDNSFFENAKSDVESTWRIYESENHHVQKNSAIWQLCLVLDRWGLGEEMLTGGTVKQHFDAWTAFFTTWMRTRATRSMFVEVQSKVYGVHTMKNVYAIYDFAPTEELRTLTKNFIDLFWVLWAQEQIDGIQGGGQSRIYPKTGVKTSGETAEWAWYYCGVGEFAPPREMIHVLLDCDYRMPEYIEDMIRNVEKRGTYTVESRPYGKSSPLDNYPDYRINTEWGHIYRYTYCTPRYILGTLMCPQLTHEDWIMISSQNRWQGVTFSVPDAVVSVLPRPNSVHNIRTTIAEIAFNAFWSMQCENTLLSQKCGYYDGTMRVWLSDAGGILESLTQKAGWNFVRCGDVYVAIRICKGGYTLGVEPSLPDGEGRWMICDTPDTPVILEVGTEKEYGSFEGFMDAVVPYAPVWEGDAMKYHSLSGHDFVMLTAEDGNSTIDGEYYVKKPDFSFRSPFVNGKWDGGKVEITYDGETHALDFSAT